MLCCANSTTNLFSCEVILLDDTVLPFSNNIHFKRNSKAQGIFNAVCDHLNLAERDYFGLQYQDKNLQKHWLDLYKTFREHDDLVHSESPCKLYFHVKFFVADPTSLREEITRYQFFLQLKKDILFDRLQCDFKKASELAALVLQSELGDYQPKSHLPGYASEFRFISNQDEEFENNVECLHRDFRGLLPAEAEIVYLRKCKQLDMYGLDIHPVQDEANIDYLIGLSAKGVEVLKNGRKIRIHYWPLIAHIEFKDRLLKIQVKNKNLEHSIYSFLAPSRAACKCLWKRAIEQHTFFRLVRSDNSGMSASFRKNGHNTSEILQSDKEKPVTFRSRSKRYPSRTKTSKQETKVPTHDAKDDRPNQRFPEKAQIGDLTSSLTQHTQNDDENLLERSGLFGCSKRGIGNNYITPKSERRQRNRQLHSLSDSENQHRKRFTRHGRSSGEESDSPSKRRISSRNSHGEGERARNRYNEKRQHKRHRRYAHTDSEMPQSNSMENENLIRTNVTKRVGERTGAKTDGARTDDGRSETPSNQSRRRRTRKKHSRLSCQDAAAQQILWQHIHKEPEDVDKYTQEQLHDIPYTEVRTEGNPLPIKLRQHKKGTNAPYHRQASRSRHSSDNLPGKGSGVGVGDGLVSPLSVTTTVRRDKVAVGECHSMLSSHHGPIGDWDTKTKRVIGYGKSHHHQYN